MTIVHSVEQIQVPLLAVVLLGAGAAKMSRALRARSVLVVLDAMSLFPLRNATSYSRSRCGLAARPFVPRWCRETARQHRKRRPGGCGKRSRTIFLRLSKAF
jgi:hypothetical protein